MAIRFQHIMAKAVDGYLPLNTGDGAIVGGNPSQGLIVDDTGALYVTTSNPIDHYSSGLPFDVNGRMCIALDAPVRVDQGVPYSVDGRVCFEGSPFTYAQGMAYSGFGAFAGADDPLVAKLSFFAWFTDDLVPLIGTGPAAFTRSTPATYVDKDTGLITLAVVDEPRFEQQGLLMEGPSENEVLQSADMSVGPWGASPSMTVSALTEPDPTGGFTGVHAEVDGSALATMQQVFSNPQPDTVYTFSFYTRNISGNLALYGVWDNGNGTWATNGNQVLIDGPPDVWVKQSVTFTSASSGLTTYGVQVLRANSGAAGAADVACAQFEAMPFATSYIPTAAIAVTREHDELQIPVTNFPDPAGSFTTSYTSSTYGGDADYAPYSVMTVNGNGGLITEQAYRDNGLNQLLMTAYGTNILATVVPDVPSRMALVRDVTGLDTQAYVNAALDTSTSGTIATSAIVTTIRLGGLGAGDELFGHLRALAIYNEALTQDEIEEDYARTLNPTT